MNAYDDAIMEIKEEKNEWPIKILTSKNNIIGFEADIAIATHYVDVTVNNKHYYGQKVLILKEWSKE